MKKKIAIIGAGNVGSTLALFLAQKELGDLALIDINGEVAQGKALDMMQAGAVFGFFTQIQAGNDFALLKDAHIVVVTAGFPRKPGMDRLELLHKNRDIIDEIASHIKKYASKAIVIVVSNPVDIMTYRMQQQTGFDSCKVMGQAGVLDTARMLSFLATKTGVNVKEITGMVLGGHGDSMVPVFDWTRINGTPVEEWLSLDKLEKIEKRTQNGGGEIVSLLKTGSAYYAPAAATAFMVEAILKDENRLMAVSCKPQGDYGLSDVYIGLPVILGGGGIKKIVSLSLPPKAQANLEKSAKIYQESIKELG